MSKQETTRDHECAGCGGSGRKAQRFDPVWPFKDSAACPVCLGSGHIVDVMPIDEVALVDAMGESPLTMTDGEYKTMKEGR